MAMSAEERRRRGVIASQKWRAKNLDKVREADRVRRKAYYVANRAKVIAANDAWRRKNPEKVKAQWKRRNEITGRTYRLRRYGLSIVEWEAMFNSQGRVCAICKRSKSGGRRGWSTDHDHETGAVRGILCNNCNTGLGLLGDNLAALLAAVSYLRKPTREAA
jgi:hypothetical protein